MHSMAPNFDERKIVVGVDTHKHLHVAIAIDELGRCLGQLILPAATDGYVQLMQWSRTLGKSLVFGIEGTGSYGAGLTRFLTHEGYTVVEVNRPDRRVRRERGKSDPTDAENAARAVLSGQARAVPKAGDQSVEMIRHVKVARDTAVPHSSNGCPKNVTDHGALRSARAARDHPW